MRYRNTHKSQYLILCKSEIRQKHIVIIRINNKKKSNNKALKTTIRNVFASTVLCIHDSRCGVEYHYVNYKILFEFFLKTCYEVCTIVGLSRTSYCLRYVYSSCVRYVLYYFKNGKLTMGKLMSSRL